jgi:hypothetical protein
MVVGGGFSQRAEFWISDYFIDNFENKSAATTTGDNFDEIKLILNLLKLSPVVMLPI